MRKVVGSNLDDDLYLKKKLFVLYAQQKSFSKVGHRAQKIGIGPKRSALGEKQFIKSTPGVDFIQVGPKVQSVAST